MKWTYEFSSDAEKDFADLDGTQKKQVLKALDKVVQNPLPRSEGGYGEPLGNKRGRNLTGLLKVKLLKLGIRIVYRLIQTTDKKGNKTMRIVVIAARADEEVYDLAWERTR